MTDSKVTPDTIFEVVEIGDAREAGQTAPDKPAAAGTERAATASAQVQYKRLIDAECKRQGLPLAHLAERCGIGRSRLHKIIRGRVALQDDLRDRLLAELEIDMLRARFSIALLHDHQAYVNSDVFVVCEVMKAFYYEIVTRQRGEIQVQLRPSIIHETQRRAYDMLLSHQARVLESERTLQA